MYTKLLIHNTCLYTCILQTTVMHEINTHTNTKMAEVHVHVTCPNHSNTCVAQNIQLHIIVFILYCAHTVHVQYTQHFIYMRIHAVSIMFTYIQMNNTTSTLLHVHCITTDGLFIVLVTINYLLFLSVWKLTGVNE